MGNTSRRLASVKWSCFCGADITSTDDGDGAYIYVQCTNGHRYKKPRQQLYKRPNLKQQLRTGYTPNDAA